MSAENVQPNTTPRYTTLFCEELWREHVAKRQPCVLEQCSDLQRVRMVVTEAQILLHSVRLAKFYKYVPTGQSQRLVC